MDNKGYVFSTDAVLALVIFFIIAGSILTYYTLPSYMGADHQHLEAEADSALAVLTTDGDLQAAILKINSGNDTQKAEGVKLLKDKLSLILPSDVAYDLKIDDVSEGISDDKGIINPNDRVSRYTVLSAPREGWLGRAWYKLEDVKFIERRINTTQSLWNFNNYLSNYNPWSGFRHRTGDFPYWGSQTTTANSANRVKPISFSVPADAKLKNAYFIIGSTGMGKNYMIHPTRFTTKFIKGSFYKDYYPIDGVWDTSDKDWGYGYVREGTTKIYPASWTVLNKRTPTFGVNIVFNNDPSKTYVGSDSSNNDTIFDYILSIDEDFYNGKGDIPIDWLNKGLNNFYVKYINASTAHQMPWFSILAEYETSIIVPEGINTDRFPEKSESAAYDCAGASKGDSYVTYNLTSGVVSDRVNVKRSIDITKYKGYNSTYADGIPFVVTNTGYGKGGSAIARTYDIDLTTNNEKISSNNVRVLDGYTVVNTYGATDKVLVEVYNGEKDSNGKEWHQVFDSRFNTDQGQGYSNTPGTVYLCDYDGNSLLRPNVVNKVRVTVWDDVGGVDYDFVGLVDTYNVVSFTEMPIRWDNYPFKNYQSNTNNKVPYSVTKSSTFSIASNPISEKVMFFFGVGLDTQHVKLEVSKGSTTETLYDSDTVPFALDIGAIDAGIQNADGSKGGKQLFAKPDGDGNYTTNSGEYTVKLTVQPGLARESGDQATSGGKDGSACAEIFSGSRVAVIYPKFLENEWINDYADTADDAKKKATTKLINAMQTSGYSVDPNLVKSEALYTGDMPNTVPIRLDLWRS